MNVYFLLQVCQYYLIILVIIMFMIVLVFLYLTSATAIASSNECECKHNLARNEFYSDQECVTALNILHINRINPNIYAETIDTHVNTLCNGKCSAKLNKLLYYQDLVGSNDRRKVSQIKTYYMIMICMYIYIYIYI